jgi:hypothetical protein
MAVDANWTVDVASVAALISSAGVVVGGFWAFFHFKKDAPYIARANVEVEAELMTHGRDDLLHVRCSASAVGRGAFDFIRDDEEHSPPSVVAYAITEEVAENPPQKWVDVCGASGVFVEDDGVESGEVLEDVVLVWVGQRVPGTLAYRVRASFSAPDGRRRRSTTWQAVAIVPVEADVAGELQKHEAASPSGPTGSSTGPVARPSR